MVPSFVVLPPSVCCPCATLLSSAACCCVVHAVVLWVVAVLSTRRASLALLSCSSLAVYRVLTLLRSSLARSSSMPLLCGLLFAFGGRRRRRFLPFPLSLGPALFPRAHFALSRLCVALPSQCLRSFNGHNHGVGNLQNVRVDQKWSALACSRERVCCRPVSLPLAIACVARACARVGTRLSSCSSFARVCGVRGVHVLWRRSALWCMCVRHTMLRSAVLVAHHDGLSLCDGVSVFPLVLTTATELVTYKVCV